MRMNWTRIVGVLLMLGAATCPAVSCPIEPGGRLTLNLTRQPKADEMVVVRVTVGVLASKTRIVVRTADGEIAGTVAPFGVRPGHKAGVFTVPIPGKAIKGKTVSLRLEVMERDAKAARGPTRAEVEEVRLALVPVTHRTGEAKK